ncbi:MAG: glutamate--tRNA ligase [Proteobacteria bacterium]|nr:glutamate--tRNA ligase [Pseudomonadota bacterium]
MSTVVTRFAPSPTGYLHIGSARTALFNWLFSKHHGGKFLLRIEDTDRERSTQQAVEAIFESLTWLELQWDDEPVFQSKRVKRHTDVAYQLLEQKKAYFCYCSPEELEQMRLEAMTKGLPLRYNGLWRDRDLREAPKDRKPVIRFKAPQDGETVIHDLVQGTIKIQNNQLDDMVLLRADGTPTYMLSVVVDDHDMNITHIIRGDDHLTNAFRQYHLYQAMGWTVPHFAHIPLIHGSDGTKLSKRHGALSAEAYREMGFLPEAMRNYLLRLGWAHKDAEIIPTEQAIEWFDLKGVGRSPARFDIAKLTNLNAHYLREAENHRLLRFITPILEEKIQRKLDVKDTTRLLKGMNGLKSRSKTLLELGTSALIYIQSPDLSMCDERKFFTAQTKIIIQKVIDTLTSLSDFRSPLLEESIRLMSQQKKLAEIAQPIRLALTGSTISPSIFDIMEVLGKEETLKRLHAFVTIL